MEKSWKPSLISFITYLNSHPHSCSWITLINIHCIIWIKFIICIITLIYHNYHCRITRCLIRWITRIKLLNCYYIICIIITLNYLLICLITCNNISSNNNLICYSSYHNLKHKLNFTYINNYNWITLNCLICNITRLINCLICLITKCLICIITCLNSRICLIIITLSWSWNCLIKYWITW